MVTTNFSSPTVSPLHSPKLQHPHKNKIIQQKSPKQNKSYQDLHRQKSEFTKSNEQTSKHNTKLTTTPKTNPSKTQIPKIKNPQEKIPSNNQNQIPTQKIQNQIPPQKIKKHEEEKILSNLKDAVQVANNLFKQREREFEKRTVSGEFSFDDRCFGNVKKRDEKFGKSGENLIESTEKSIENNQKFKKNKIVVKKTINFVMNNLFFKL
jgi:hypothetical protein